MNIPPNGAPADAGIPPLLHVGHYWRGTTEAAHWLEIPDRNRVGSHPIKFMNCRRLCSFCLWLSFLVVGVLRSSGGTCAVSEGSLLPSEDGCTFAYVFNQEHDHRLVVIDEKSRRRYEAPLKEPKHAPFWDRGRVYVLNTAGSVQSYGVVAEKLVAGKEENLSLGLVMTAEYVRRQHRLYVIRSANPGNITYEILAIDFPTRKVLWAHHIAETGLLRIYDNTISVTGAKLVQVFKSDTGKKVAEAQAVKNPDEPNAEK